MFLAGNAGCEKSFLMRVIYQSLIKTLSYGSTLVDKPKALLMAPTGVAAINIDGTTIFTFAENASEKRHNLEMLH